MINIAIVEDMKKWADDIKAETETFLAEKSCQIDIYDCAETFLNIRKDYRIVFMDIELKEMNGLEAAKQYKKQYPETLMILVTCHLEYSMEGYKVNAFRYLDKGNLKDNIREALEHAVLRLQRYERVRFRIVNEDVLALECRDILYIETYGRNVRIHTNGGDYISCEKISELAEQLESRGFFRCHKSYLVNFDWVDEIVRDEFRREGRKLLMKNGEKVDIAYKKINETRKKWYEWKFLLANQ